MKTYAPDWAIKHRQKGTQIIKIRSNYYLYKISSRWDKKKKRAVKVTEEYLGKITPEGLIKPKHKRAVEVLQHLTVKEYGASHFTSTIAQPIQELLKKHFPDEWETILVFAVERLFHASPMKNVTYYFNSSHLSDIYHLAQVSPKNLSDLLFSLGRNRGKLCEFMKTFVVGVDFAVIDLTHVFSLSENIISSTLGHNSEKNYTPQVNLTLIFSLDKQQPVFYRIVPGSISDVSVIPATLRESGVKKAVVIGDKGFHSANNTEFLEQQLLEYILPIKRNDSRIDYAPISGADRKGFGDYFLFEERCIWHYEKKLENNRRIILFLDEKLKAEEEKDFLTHVNEQKLALDEFYQKQFTLGTIAVLTNTPYTPERVYELLKSRIEIEVLFDTLKNTLHADRTYMRDDTHLEGWMFINFIALLLYYLIYNLLVDKKLLKKYSPKDVLLHMSRVNKIQAGEKWYISEIPKTTRMLAEKMEIELHIT